jgi:hypothetical protein
MSGGHWDYMQYRFTDVADDIDKLIEQNGQPKTEEELKEDRWSDDEWYVKYPEDKFHHKYSDEVIEQFKISSMMIKKAQLYMHRMDWLLSGDDGAESFLRRINEELKELENGETDNTQ